MSRTSIALAIILMLLFSCEEGFITDCSQCYTSDDYQVILTISHSTPQGVPVGALVTLYEGPVGDNLVLEKYIVQDPYSDFRYIAVLYKDYSATIEYTYNERNYVITAGACPKVKYDETTCEEPCYYVYDNVLDLRLRYD